MFRPAALVLLVSIAALAAPGCSSNSDGEERSRATSSPDLAQRQKPQPAAPPVQTASANRAAAKGGYKGPLPPVPFSPYAAAPPDVVGAVYEFAARRADVLRYVPCFCGCERNGHQDNEDCFVASRDAAGRPEWDAHGLT
jgi:hypothetical protein